MASYRWMNWVKFKTTSVKFIHYFRGIDGICFESTKKNQKIAACDRLDLETQDDCDQFTGCQLFVHESDHLDVSMDSKFWKSYLLFCKCWWCGLWEKVICFWRGSINVMLAFPLRVPACKKVRLEGSERERGLMATLDNFSSLFAFCKCMIQQIQPTHRHISQVMSCVQLPQLQIRYEALGFCWHPEALFSNLLWGL